MKYFKNIWNKIIFRRWMLLIFFLTLILLSDETVYAKEEINEPDEEVITPYMLLVLFIFIIYIKIIKGR